MGYLQRHLWRKASRISIMDKRSGISFFTSLLLHSIVFIFLILGGGSGPGGEGDKGDGDGQGSKYEGVEVGNVIPKEKPTEVEIIEIPEPEESEISLPKEEKKQLIDADAECPDKWYGGIGVRNGWDPVLKLERVSEVFPGYAADIAGLKAGDLILWISDIQIIGEPGTVLRMRVMRGDQVLNLTLTRVKVCY